MKRKIKKDQKKMKKGHFEHFDLTIWVFDAFADDMLFHFMQPDGISHTCSRESKDSTSGSNTSNVMLNLAHLNLLVYPSHCRMARQLLSIHGSSHFWTSNPYSPGIEHNNEIYPTYGTRNSAIFAFGYVLLARR